MRKSQLVAIIAIIGALVTINDANAQKQRQKYHPLSRYGIRFVPPTEQLKKCRKNIGTASHVFQIEVKDPLNIRDMNLYVSEMNVDSTGMDGDYGSHYDYQFVNIASPPSHFDLDLNLYPASTPMKNSVVYIKVVLDGSIAKFPKDISITTNHPNGHSMFCGLRELNDQTAIFTAHYVRPTSGHVYGSFNINLVVPDAGGGGFVLPITIDPSVKNDG